MAEAWKNMLNLDTVTAFAKAIQSVYKEFPVDEFVKSTVDETWNDLELMARGKKVTVNMRVYLPQDYSEALRIMDKAIAVCDDFFKLCFPTYVEMYGQDDVNWDLSMRAMELYTQYSSSEFAVRPFIIKHEKRMMEQMYAWSKHENEHVRRLSSEGCRPALPWGQALVSFKKDPSPILPILEQLKTDPSAYVRKSVANNINDISKTHPDLVAKLAKRWYGKHEYTDWIVKHGCRTLLKKGNRDVLAIFGFHDVSSVDAHGFVLDKNTVAIGEEFTFSFDISTKEATKVRLEYGVDFVKSNGKRNRKIFQISEISFAENQKKAYSKKHSFEDLSTRKHYPGSHSITLIVNGTERGTLDFELTV
ncbi:MAG: DNA alkylation repair protein [Oscillospiraceae bacterium]|nr:DNA alkylation repair protein [Oscillospiraceae bacterium]